MASTSLVVMLPFIISSDVALPGESTRAIAPIDGVSHMQVSNDIKDHEEGVKNFTPEPAPSAEPVAKITEAESQKQP